jgi:replication initiation protein RepC
LWLGGNNLAIPFKDSPNGKRWGRRDADGVIVEAYGFDLSPTSAPVDEFEGLYAQLKAERELCLRLKRQITVARRMMRARIETALDGALSGPWGQLIGFFKDLLERLPRRHEASETLERLLAWFKALQERIEASFLSVTAPNEFAENSPQIEEQVSKKTQYMNPKEAISEPHILVTNQLNLVICKSSEAENVESVVPNAPLEERVDTELEEWVAESRKKRGAVLDLPTVMQVCPEFSTWARSIGGYLKDWGDLHRVVGQLRPMIGVSEDAWNLAQDRLRPQIATAALVLVIDKHCAGEVASPGGYLRGMVEKAGAGELHLERSFYGRLNGQAA